MLYEVITAAEEFELLQPHPRNDGVHGRSQGRRQIRIRTRRLKGGHAFDMGMRLRRYTGGWVLASSSGSPKAMLHGSTPAHTGRP